MIVDKYNLNRFIEAQSGVYHIALKELQDGRKRSHWMWYIFPQFKHLGYSRNSKFYGISGPEEAAAYLENPVLSQRLREVSATILNLPTDDAVEIFGEIDARKRQSSMTLFDLVSPNDIYAQVLDKYFNGQRDKITINIIRNEK
mgnify:CR=1 FL=1